MAAPEIRLGSLDNLPNIQLGSVQMEEVRLGNVLVWQNNQGPVFIGLNWDGTLFSVPMPFEDFTGTATSFTGQVNGGPEDRDISLIISGISDPDNPDADDFIVGYRLLRPDGTYFAGNPADPGNNAFGAPISSYGEPLPGIAAVYDAATDEFTGGIAPTGAAPIANSTITVRLRHTDLSGAVVDSLMQEFVDDGPWVLTVIDSRGGESGAGTMNISLEYQDPAGNVRANIGEGVAVGTDLSTVQTYTNPTIATGGTNPITVGFNNTGGPLTTTGTQYNWSCTGCTPTSGTGSTFQFTPTNITASGSDTAVVTASVMGRSWLGNAATTPPGIQGRAVYGVSCTPRYTVSTSGYTIDNACAPFGGTVNAGNNVTITCVGDCPTAYPITAQPNASGSFPTPSPGCVGVPLEATVSVSGSNVVTIGTSMLSAGGSMRFIGSTPSAGYTCIVNPGSVFRQETIAESRDSPTCDIAGTPASLNLGPRSGACFIEAASLGAPLCAGGRRCGTFTADCGTVLRNSSVTVSGSGCETPGAGTPLNFSGTVGAATMHLSFMNRVSIPWTTSRTASSDTGAIGNLRFTVSGCSARAGSGSFENLGNGSSPLNQTGTSNFNLLSGVAGETCTITGTVTSGGYGGSVVIGTTSWTIT